MGLQVPIVFDGLLHLGTIFVTLVFFRKEIKNIFVALWHRDFKSENGRLIPLIVVGTIPTALIGVVFGDTIESAFAGFLPIAGAFAFCGVALYVSRFGKETKEGITYSDAVVIGIAQGIAIVPGISRSGFTIATALLLGVKREKAFTFSFLLSVPAIAGALGLTFYTEQEALSLAGINATEILIGIIVSMLIGYLALKLLSRIVLRKKFYLFAFYCWLFAVVLVGLAFGGF